MRISDWSSDVCSSDLVEPAILKQPRLIAKSIETQGPDAQFGDLLLQFGEEQLNHRSTHRVGRAAPREDRLPAIERVQHLQNDICLEKRMVERGEIGRAQYCNPVNYAQLVCSHLLEKKT